MSTHLGGSFDCVFTLKINLKIIMANLTFVNFWHICEGNWFETMQP